MAFFDKVTDKARELADSAKANVKIAEEKRRITELKELAGSLVWKEYSEGTAFSESISEVCAKIKAAYDNIDAITNELANGKQRGPEAKTAESDTVKCASCGAELAKEQKFCTNCGAKVPEQPQEKPDKPFAKRVCVSCGVDLTEGAVFCPNCGAKISVQAEGSPSPAEASETPDQAPVQPLIKHVCASCGAEISDDQAFCPKCGAKC